MSTLKLVTIVGARPQFVKAAAVSRALAEQPTIEEIIVHTGQHFDANMSAVFFDQLGIPAPLHQLDVHGGSHGAMTGRMLEAIEALLLDVRPDRLLVYGDTNSTLAGALAAAKLHIPVSHVEAGLRSYDRTMPEEVNRLLTDHLCDQLFCPTDAAVVSLRSEGIVDGRTTQVSQVGDVMQDATVMFRDRAEPPAGFSRTDFALATVHRAENTDDPRRLAGIVTALNHIHSNLVPVVLPLHPRTKAAVASLGLDLEVDVLEPVGYLEMLWLLDHAGVVLTDSGGLQKEAYFFAKPCVTLRDNTEWVELIAAGANVLVGADTQRIVAATRAALGTVVVDDAALYGGGVASVHVAQLIATRRTDRS